MSSLGGDASVCGELSHAGALQTLPWATKEGNPKTFGDFGIYMTHNPPIVEPNSLSAKRLRILAYIESTTPQTFSGMARRGGLPSMGATSSAFRSITSAEKLAATGGGKP